MFRNRARRLLGGFLVRHSTFRSVGHVFEKGIQRHGLVQFLQTIQRRQLQQFNGLLQPRCESELLLQS
jgi:hypothetical protein